MKVFIFGDTQIDGRMPFDKLDSRGRSIRLRENIDHIKRMMDTAKARGCTFAVHQGDLTERKNPTALEMDACAEFFAHWAEGGKYPVRVLAGNHDNDIASQNGSSISTFGTILGQSYFKTYHQLSFEDVEDQTRFVYLPFLFGKTPEDIGELIRLYSINHPVQVSNSGTQYLFMHYGVGGAVTGPSNYPVPGDKLGPGNLHPELFKAIFAGHVHTQQKVRVGKVDVLFSGSPVVNNFGERNASQGWAFLDTQTGQYELIPVEPPRRWIDIPYSQFIYPSITGEDPWGPEDIVKISGECFRGSNPQKTLDDAFASGLTKPFALKISAKPQAQERVDRDGKVAKAGSIMDSARALAEKLYPDQDIEPALALVEKYLYLGRKPILGEGVYPVSLSAKKFMTWDDLEIRDLRAEEPTLLCGENGLGKTNLFEAVIVALTGETSKGIPLSNFVRQGEKSTEISLGVSVGQECTVDIQRAVILNDKGEARQKLEVQVQNYDDSAPYPLGGSIKEIQKQLEELLGFSYLSLRYANFSFQKDNDTYTRTSPRNRMKILSAIFNQESILKAHTQINKDRLAKEKDLEQAQAVLKALEALKPEKSLEDLAVELENLGQRLTADRARHKLAKSELQQAKQEQEERNKEFSRVEAEEKALVDPYEEIEVKKKKIVDTEAAQTKALKDAQDSWMATHEEIRTFQRDRPMVDHAALKGTLDSLLDKKKTFSDKRTALEVSAREASGEYMSCGPTLQVLTLEIEGLEKSIQAFSSDPNQVCSSCHQKVSLDHLKSELEKKQGTRKAGKDAQEVLRLKMVKANGEVALKDQELASVVSEIETTTKLLNAEQIYLEKLSGLTRLLAEKEASGKKLKEDQAKTLSDLRDDLQKLEDSNLSYASKKNELGRLLTISREGLDKANTKLSACDANERSVASACLLGEAAVKTKEAERSKAREYTDSISEKIRAVQDLEKVFQHYLMAQAIVDPKSGLPVYLIDTKLPELEEKTNEYLDRLGLESFRVRLTTEGDELSVLVDNGKSPMLDIRAYSGGQLDRVEIASKMAMLDFRTANEGSIFGMLGYDEPTGGLDAAGKEALAQILYEKCQDYPAIWVVSHDDGLASAFNRRVTVVGGETGSRLVF